jgi:hypothetical protein
VKISKGLEHPPELDLPCSPPVCFLHIWNWFWDISRSRDDGVISNQELLAWCQLRSIKLTRLEIDILGIMDIEYVKTSYQIQKNLSGMKSFEQKAQLL